MTTDRLGPLAHVKVLDLSRMFPGAFCTLILADLGADVVKVEGPGAGDGMRAMAAPGAFNAAHTGLNRGKRSLVLDLRNAGAVAVLKRLVRWADVVIESHKPGQLDGLGLGYEVMSVENPGIVWCSLTGFGDFGPNAQAAGHDITYLGYSGLMGRLADGPTTPPAAPISLPLTGLMGAVGILAAFANAQRTGKGTRLDANMVDTAMWTLSEDVARAASAPGPGWGTMAARNVYACGDGREVTVASNEPRTWAKLCEGLDVPDLAGHRIGVDEDAPACARLAEVFATKSAAQWLANPGLAGGVGPVFDAPDLLDDPQVTARRSLQPLPGSGARVLANPLRFNGGGGDDDSYGLRDAPALGADTADALAAAGFSSEEIDTLLADKVVQ
jgi:alpha-methylacyl-CoA racemase